jgi:hypothetical protein
MDNWIHNSTSAIRLRRINGQWVKDAVPVLGHYGMGMDDFGRTYFNTNGAPLRANFISTHYQLRNPDFEGANGIFAPITGDTEREVFPIRPNPGSNRGYVKGTLRSDGRLLKYTAGCGISIFRGDRLPDDVKGNHFFCEPAGNLVRRTILTERDDGTIDGRNAHPGAEFLASTEERFRPVFTCTAPDGTLYICDMYRGVLESHPFVTTYLKRQIYERGLNTPLDRGRFIGSCTSQNLPVRRRILRKRARANSWPCSSIRTAGGATRRSGCSSRSRISRSRPRCVNSPAARSRRSRGCMRSGRSKVSVR